MNFYSARITYEPASYPLTSDVRRIKHDLDQSDSQDNIREKIRRFNERLANVGGMGDKDIQARVYTAFSNELYVALSIDQQKIQLKTAKTRLLKEFKNEFDIANARISNVKEVIVSTFTDNINNGEHDNYIAKMDSIVNDLNSLLRGNNFCRMSELLIENKNLSYDKARECAIEILADISLIDEIDRIYDPDNEKKYYGNPVHYKVTASNRDSAQDIIELLVKSLLANKRLISHRMTKITDIEENCYDEEDITHIFELAQGGVVVIDMSGSRQDHGQFASAYEEVIRFFRDNIVKYQMNTLFIFLEISKHPGFSNHLTSSIQEDIDIIELKEGSAEKEAAKEFIIRTLDKNNIKADITEIDAMMKKQNVFTAGEAYEITNQIFKEGLKNFRYKAYKKVSFIQVQDSRYIAEPYEELQRMIGLKEAKRIVDGILDIARVNDMRIKMGLDHNKASLHMIFTGNPGSAKTTVARLIADIMKNEGILETGNYVECGRADLVGKYVGWTAKTVRTKFKQAKGGILFIDEAYSLVDSSDSFGDEAINTIVQEMENHRDDVIVIFAGYPEKMMRFLEANEGLRSRISFHINFPDYKENELFQILELMAEKKGYVLENGIKDKCISIFRTARKKKDFGNGRFVRNLLEQAEIAHASRVLKENKGNKINADVLNTLKTEDFIDTDSLNVKQDKVIGFVV